MTSQWLGDSNLDHDPEVNIMFGLRDNAMPQLVP